MPQFSVTTSECTTINEGGFAYTYTIRGGQNLLIACEIILYWFLSAASGIPEIIQVFLYVLLLFSSCVLLIIPVFQNLCYVYAQNEDRVSNAHSNSCS